MDPDSSIWIVDDEPDLANAYADFLSPHYQTKVFHTPNDALKYFDTGCNEPSLIVSDLKLPDMDGISFIHEIRKRKKDLAAILISGHSQKDDLVAANDLGIQGYLDKPFDPNRLESLISDILSSKKKFQELNKLVESYTEATEELTVLYVNRYAQAENALLQAEIIYPNPNDKKKYVEALMKENNLNRKIENIKSEFKDLALWK